VLLLRGAQTPGELRSRTNRLCEFPDGGAVESALKSLMEREDGPFVARLIRAPGEREARYTHLFSGIPSAAATGEEVQAEESAAAPRPGERLSERVSALEEAVRQLRAELDDLKRAAGLPAPREPV
jgi:uncharacterized protein